MYFRVNQYRDWEQPSFVCKRVWIKPKIAQYCACSRANKDFSEIVLNAVVLEALLLVSP